MTEVLNAPLKEGSIHVAQKAKADPTTYQSQICHFGKRYSSKMSFSFICIHPPSLASISSFIFVYSLSWSSGPLLAFASYF